VQSDEKARASSLVEKLEVVEEFVSQKYCEATTKSQLEEVVNSLRLLS
jgi:hypothetical protein